MNFPQDEANKIKKEASDLDKLVDKTEKEYNDLREDLRGKETEVRKLLEKGKTEQQVHACSPTVLLFIPVSNYAHDKHSKLLVSAEFDLLNVSQTSH